MLVSVNGPRTGSDPQLTRASAHGPLIAYLPAAWRGSKLTWARKSCCGQLVIAAFALLSLDGLSLINRSRNALGIKNVDGPERSTSKVPNWNFR